MSPDSRDGRPVPGTRLDPKKVLAEAIAGGDADQAAGGWEPPGVAQLDAAFEELHVVELIGRGGMGAVYRAVQRKLDRTVALKVLPPELAKDASFEERFLREARALAGLKHARILTVHDFGERDGLYYLVSEFVEGMNLRQLMEMGELSPSEALRITPQICEALQYAHDHGVVHRDIKPENLLIDTSGDVRIADFGLARILNDDATMPTLTRSTQVLGTPQYMAPEQWRDGPNVDHRADIYAVGVVLYEMLTGELPLGHFDPPSTKKGVPRGLDAVVQRSLAQRPEQRYQRASDVGEELERQASEAGTSSPANPPPPPPAARAPAAHVPQRPPQWDTFPGALGLAWLLLVLLLGAGAFLLKYYLDQGSSGSVVGPLIISGMVILIFFLCGMQTLHEIRHRQRSTAYLKLAVLTTWMFPVIGLSAIATGIVAKLVKDPDIQMVSGIVTALVFIIGGFTAMGWLNFRLSQDLNRAGSTGAPPHLSHGRRSESVPGPLRFAWWGNVVGIVFMVFYGTMAPYSVEARGALSSHGSVVLRLLGICALMAIVSTLCGCNVLYNMRRWRYSIAWLKLAIVAAWCWPVLVMAAVVSSVLASSWQFDNPADQAVVRAASAVLVLALGIFGMRQHHTHLFRVLSPKGGSTA